VLKSCGYVIERSVNREHTQARDKSAARECSFTLYISEEYVTQASRHICMGTRSLLGMRFIGYLLETAQ
jgi:hypothetical protein